MENFDYDKTQAQDVNFVILDPPKNIVNETGEIEDINMQTSTSFENINLSEAQNFENKTINKDSKKKKKYRLEITITPLFVIFFLLLTLSIGFLGGFLSQTYTNSSFKHFGEKITDLGSAKPKSENSDKTQTLPTAKAEPLSIEEIVEMNENSIVEIRTEGVSTDSWFRQYIKTGAGSGVIVSTDGYIITNNHVIEKSNKIVVTLKNNKNYDAVLIGHDTESDLALLKIDAKDLDPIVYGSSKDTKVGEISVVIGNPLGNLGGTVTQGIISALDREINLDGQTMRLMQTDASVNPGNSGGGMFNDQGELIGIVVAKTGGTNVEGIGFAIPVDKVKVVAKELGQFGYVRGRPSTGMTYIDLTSVKDALVYGVPNLGIYVKSVDSDLAKKAGFKEGDMVFYVDKKQIKTVDDLIDSIESRKVGEVVEFRVIREDSIIKLNLTLGEKTR